MSFFVFFRKFTLKIESLKICFLTVQVHPCYRALRSYSKEVDNILTRG